MYAWNAKTFFDHSSESHLWGQAVTGEEFDYNNPNGHGVGTLRYLWPLYQDS